MMTADQAREADPLAARSAHQAPRRSGRLANARLRTGRQPDRRTPAWVQRIIGRREDATVGLHDAFNIRTAYDAFALAWKASPTLWRLATKNSEGNWMRLLAAIGRVCAP